MKYKKTTILALASLLLISSISLDIMANDDITDKQKNVGNSTAVFNEEESVGISTESYKENDDETESKLDKTELVELESGDMKLEETDSISNQPDGDTSKSSDSSPNTRISFDAELLTLGLDSVASSVASGQSAKFNIDITNNAYVTSPSATLEITWDNIGTLDNPLNDLSIDGVIPKINNNTLLYEFTDFKPGVTSRTSLSLSTENGMIPDASNLNVKAVLTANSQTQSKNANVIINSNVHFSTTNKYLGIRENNQIIAKNPSPGDEVIYDLRMNVPKLNYGVQYLDENKTIRVTFKIPTDFEYVETIGTSIAPTQEADGTLVWQIATPTYEQQRQATDSIIPLDFKVVLKIKNSAELFVLKGTEFEVKAPFFGHFYHSDIAESKVMISSNNAGDRPFNPGSILAHVHSGPQDGFGTVDEYDWKNFDPKVYDNALLNYSVSLISGLVNHRSAPIDVLQLDYSVDPNLEVRSISAGDFYYRLALEDPYIKLVEEAKVELYGSEDGVTYTLLDDDFKEHETYTFDDTERNSIHYIRVGLSKAPAGFYSYIGISATPKKGYVGAVTNKAKIETKGLNSNGRPVHYISSEEGLYNVLYDQLLGPGSGFFVHEYMGPQTAEIVAPSTGKHKVMKTRVEFPNIDSKYKTLTPGNETLRLKLMSDAASQEIIEGTFNGVVVLPKGVTYTDNKDNITVIEENGIQKLVVKLDNVSLSHLDDLTLDFDVNISKNALQHLHFDFYLEVPDDVTVPTQSGSIESESSQIIIDTEDINNNNNTTERLIHTKIEYALNINSIIKARQFVGVDNNNTIKTYLPGEKVDLTLELEKETNKQLQNFILINTIPNINNDGLFENNIIPSTFDTTLNGPISLPDSWKDRVAVYYSTDTSPSLEGVIDEHTIYPNGITPLKDLGIDDTIWVEENDVSDYSIMKSFKIVMLDKSFWLDTEDAQVQFSVTIPKSTNLGHDDFQLSFNEFILAANTNMPIRPVGAGIQLTYENLITVSFIDETGKTLKQEESFTLKEGEQKIIEPPIINGYQLVKTQVNDVKVDDSTQMILASRVSPRTKITYTFSKDETKDPENSENSENPENPKVPEKPKVPENPETPNHEKQSKTESTQQNNELPKTGIKTMPLTFVVGILLMGIGFVILNKRLQVSKKSKR